MTRKLLKWNLFLNKNVFSTCRRIEEVIKRARRERIFHLDVLDNGKSYNHHVEFRCKSLTKLSHTIFVPSDLLRYPQELSHTKIGNSLWEFFQIFNSALSSNQRDEIFLCATIKFKLNSNFLLCWNGRNENKISTISVDEHRWDTPSTSVQQVESRDELSEKINS